ncbi:porin family protein [Massilia sp. Dwa41.01b]|uniref:porin family protein n=1 Tax=unclassified Massilia TaxID=2609279 RepID=UPI001603DD07|nr:MULTISPECIES: porin family protein [unclassified Massilia]QNA90016.1 porin family protein [Massilia sp. Dwa41.01b]QNB00904.1 porin family protein [Massilia sp. Se16.2.3]
MTKSLLSTLIAASLFASTAQAQQAYVGATVAAGATWRYQERPGSPNADEKVMFGKLYGGYAFNDHFALEGGWGAYEKATFDKAETGAPQDAALRANLVYLAARGSYRLNDAWSLTGKLGAVRHFQEESIGATSTKYHDGSAMFGVGTAYQLTPHAALTLEYNDYGKIRTPDSKRTVRHLEAGLTFGF